MFQPLKSHRFLNPLQHRAGVLRWCGRSARGRDHGRLRHSGERSLAGALLASPDGASVFRRGDAMQGGDMLQSHAAAESSGGGVGEEE